MREPAQKKRIISIHALLAESDDNISISYAPQVAISIHALLAESDLLVADRPG